MYNKNMKKYFSKQFTQTIIGLSLAVVIGLGANFASAVWQGPSGNPTSGNPNNILTTGFDQVKTGKLGVHTSEAVPNNIALKVNNDALAYTGINAQKGLLVNGFASIFGNAGLYGDTYVGPKQNLQQSPVKFQVTGRSALGTSAIVGSSTVLDTENQNKLVVAGSSILGSVRVGGTEDINNSPGYALELRGTTNIGMGDKCTLNASDNDIGCPLGSFVQGVQYTEQDGPESVSVTCQYFEPAENQPINIGDCYAGPGSGANNPMNVTMTNSGAPSCNSGGLTILDVNSDSAPITGGNEPYTYTWYHQEIDGDDYPLNNPPTNGWGSPIATWNFSQLFVSVGTPSYYPNIDTHFWKVVVTDDSGDSDVAYYGAYDVLCN
jgi:hypothetical protein